jgi:YjbE family integral membrane protein
VSFLTDPEFWARWVGIVLINLALSGDNAVVIALAVRTLPPRQALIGRIWGTVGAVVLRLVFVAIVTALLQVPLLQIVGGLLLIWIAIKLVRPGTEGEGEAARVREGASPWEAVWIIILADVVMSFDNVIAIAGAAHGNMTLVAFGIGLSIPLVIVGSGLLATLMNRFEWIVWLGGGILGYVGGEMIAKDALAVRVLGAASDVVQHGLAASLAVAITALAWWLSRRRRAALEEGEG